MESTSENPNINRALTAHEEWLATGQGKRLVVHEGRVGNLNFTGKDLRCAKFLGVNVFGVRFHDADLREADLSECKGLTERCLGGADLRCAILPQGFAFEELKNAQELSKAAQGMVVALWSLCVYALLVVSKTTDLDLLSDSQTVTLPLLGAPMSVSSFFYWTPLILLFIFLFIHIYLQRLWQALANLPAYFPDGLALHQKTNNWLFDTFVTINHKRASHEMPIMIRGQFVLAVFLLYWVGAVTILFVWLRYLCRHDLQVSYVHCVSITGVVFFATIFYYFMSLVVSKNYKTLEIFTTKVDRHTKFTYNLSEVLHTCAFLFFGLIVFTGFHLFTTGAIDSLPLDIRDRIQGKVYVSTVSIGEGQSRILKNWYSIERPEGTLPIVRMNNERLVTGIMIGTHMRLVREETLYIPSVLDTIHSEAFLSLNFIDVSQKPSSWNGVMDKRLDLIKGIVLKDANLRFASCNFSFWVRSDLSGTDFTLANMRGADLRLTVFSKSTVSGVDFRDADLRGADFTDATGLDRCWLRGAKIDSSTKPINFDWQNRGVVFVKDTGSENAASN